MKKQKENVIEVTKTGQVVSNSEMVPVVNPPLVVQAVKNLMQQEELPTYCSVLANSVEERKNLYNAINNPEKKLADCINLTIEAKDFYVEFVELVNETTGEVSECPRIVIIDKNGISYSCVSVGIFSALKKICKFFGEPTWTTPVKLMVKQITKGERKILSLHMV